MAFVQPWNSFQSEVIALRLRIRRFIKDHRVPWAQTVLDIAPNWPLPTLSSLGSLYCGTTKVGIMTTLGFQLHLKGCKILISPFNPLLSQEKMEACTFLVPCAEITPVWFHACGHLISVPHNCYWPLLLLTRQGPFNLFMSIATNWKRKSIYLQHFSNWYRWEPYHFMSMHALRRISNRTEGLVGGVAICRFDTLQRSQ